MSEHTTKENFSQVRRKMIALVGPTAAGKSAWGLAIAKRFDGFILSCDSRQIFKGASIGTGQVGGRHKHRIGESIVDVEGIPHYFVNVLSPLQAFSVASFQKQALKIIKKEPLLPILVGGTGFYVSAIIDGWDFSSGAPDSDLRKVLAERSMKELSDQLQALDPDAKKIIATKNRRRIERAIEATVTAGVPFSQQKKSIPQRFDALQIGIHIPFNELERRIAKRVDAMIASGLMHEVRTLQRRYGDRVLDRLGIGYREIGDYLASRFSIEEAVRLIKVHTRQYAKRQLTWFKRDKRIQWVETLERASDLVEQFLRVQ